jgi:hypothetical protein
MSYDTPCGSLTCGQGLLFSDGNTVMPTSQSKTLN